MSKKIINILCVIFIIQAITACTVDTFDMYKDSMYEDWQDPKTRKAKGNENDVNDLSGCPVLVEMGRWETDGRDQSWIESGGIYHGTGVALDLPLQYGNNNLAIIIKDKSFYPVYIGHWHPITLTRTEGSFFSKQEIKEEKIIRFFAYQKTEGGRIYSQYESQTEENKNIPEKPFSLSPTGKIVPDRSDLCTVKWTAKYGYNAVAEVKSKNPFSKNYLVPTGKIIETKE